MTDLPKNLNAILQSFPSYDELKKDYAAHGYLADCYEQIIQMLREYDTDIQRDLQRLVNKARVQSPISAELQALDRSYSLKVVSRVKSLESIYKKLCEGTISWENLPLEDILGYRVVCRFWDECTELRDLLDNALHHAPFSLQSRFPRDAQGNWAEKESYSGYRSFDFAFVYQRSDIGVSFEGELQLRTMLQHAWAEVSHDTFYKNTGLGKTPPLFAEGTTQLMHTVSDTLQAADRQLVLLRKLVVGAAKGEGF